MKSYFHKPEVIFLVCWLFSSENEEIDHQSSFISLPPPPSKEEIQGSSISCPNYWQISNNLLIILLNIGL